MTVALRKDFGATVLAGWFVACLAFWKPASVLAGWLAAFALVAAVPLGALGLGLMMRLMPGPWSREFGPSAERAMTPLPLLLVAILPLLIGVHAVYPWTNKPASTFQALYLQPVPFAIRSLLILTGAWLLSRRLRGGMSYRLAVIGLIGFVLLDGILAVDWLMSLVPDFHSSGFGLFILSGQMLTATALLAIHRLLLGRQANAGLIAKILLVALLSWIYLAFMQYFIIWSGNLAAGVRWYQQHGAGIWSPAEYVLVATHAGPALALMLAPVRASRRWLVWLSATVLVGRAIEAAWLVLPTFPGTLDFSLPVFAFATLALGWAALRSEPSPHPVPAKETSDVS